MFVNRGQSYIFEFLIFFAFSMNISFVQILIMLTEILALINLYFV